MISVTITLADSNVHRLDLLMIAALAAESPARSCPAYEFRELNLLADNSNGAGTIYVGNSDVTNAIFAYTLQGGQSRYYPPKSLGAQLYYTSTMYILGSAGLILHVEGSN